ncbi:glycosyltransferase family 1 protein [Aurantiacibacter xanthus]|uniref:Glycosyltransferase family 1 protein n=1 Tax=Aurantiacibacter xanthus TaxID=1784712 RepID=A0A3A1P4K9_9SPHN|nr:glycosyltransferase family 1 protein [Aurantiacibacter xanthus]RIV86391.1 glycosyltransferase family 1 protein [Aurantiacibacter xanthus]
MPDTRPDLAGLRVAMFSGNYNYVRDGANKAQNRLVGTLMEHGADMRVYSPTIPNPPFPPTGPLVSIPSFAIPGRSEYRIPTGLSAKVRADLEKFDPQVIHISSPDRAARQAVAWGRRHGKPVVCTIHTRFETYPRYYGFGFAEGLVEAWLRKLYRRCDILLCPSPTMIGVLKEQGMNDRVEVWSRGVEKQIFNPGARDLAWRRSIGLADEPPVIGFLGRLVLEKGLDVFAETLAELRQRGVPHQVMVVGEGPAKSWFAEHTPGAAFAGFLAGEDLGRAVASMDMLFNPSVTETFGNVTLEAMASGVPVVAAKATGSSGLVADGRTGRLVDPTDIAGFADALAAYCEDPALGKAHGAAAAEAAKAYDWETINLAVGAIYRQLLAERAAA